MPHVEVTGLAQHLAEQARPVPLVRPVQPGEELVDADVLVPEEVGTQVPLSSCRWS